MTEQQFRDTIRALFVDVFEPSLKDFIRTEIQRQIPCPVQPCQRVIEQAHDRLAK